jgi:aromatic amino acid aminotransferase I
LKKPGLISLGGGLPCPENFPFEEINMKVPKPPQFSEQETRENGQMVHAGKYDASEGKSVYDLSIAMVSGLENYIGDSCQVMLEMLTVHLGRIMV